MSSPRSPLAAKQADFTQGLILNAGVALLLERPNAELSVRAVAKRAEMSERTIFRYFPNRDELLEAVAMETFRRIEEPPYPTSIAELLDYPHAMFQQFERASALTKAGLHSDIYHRIRTMDAANRLVAIRKLLDRAAPERPEDERRLAAANIHYHVIASTWRYYRDYFGFSLADTIDAACTCIQQILLGLGISLPQTRLEGFAGRQPMLQTTGHSTARRRR